MPMDSLNAVALTGFLELDLTTRWQGDASQCTTFTMRLEEQGADKVHLVYVPVVCWGKTAERAADLSPGALIGVQGKLVYRRAPDRPAEHTGRLVVMASSVVCVMPAPVAVA
jgi:single-stranded DNA-binding protein